MECISMGCRQKNTLKTTDLFHMAPARIKQINTCKNTCKALTPAPHRVNASYSLSLIILGKGGLGKTFQSTERSIILINYEKNQELVTET